MSKELVINILKTRKDDFSTVYNRHEIKQMTEAIRIIEALVPPAYFNPDVKVIPDIQKWLDTEEEGKKSNDYTTLTGQEYLTNRLWHAFHAGTKWVEKKFYK